MTETVLVQVPGYTITETTTGYYYPERLGIRRGTAGDYYWATLPAAFTCKAIRR
jgi:hypothetical protein